MKSVQMPSVRVLHGTVQRPSSRSPPVDMECTDAHARAHMMRTPQHPKTPCGWHDDRQAPGMSQANNEKDNGHMQQNQGGWAPFCRYGTPPPPCPFVIATQQHQINTVPMPTAA